MNYNPEKMSEILEENKENILKGSINFKCANNIYEVLLKTGKYIDAKDIIYQIILQLFLIKIF